ncbi:MAG: acetyl-CoA C-acyltransferase [Xanthomonadales bacterium]|nr:acetyl-CoA C-acyltransferase [Xanthomonadales bacterium]NIN59954.1 acetyl-CoA C-acyltransferase [Xanthomonadales bacterium]NIN75328.1 acetyl-CoA C-acyltransferase [Xanthomonadales bacterium]NIO13497.1 acetyl-CoA C-acyltransferase [Xanthomonadales bacterium]NIP12347.1 acetyl-CoA C-acyltransferase [Xanthomonadales bacterium]
MSTIVITGAKRTAIGSFQGQFTDVPADELGAAAIRGAVEQSGIDGSAVDNVLMGCVLPAGVGQAPARLAARKAGIPDSAGAVTLNKACSSGLIALMMGHDSILAGSAAVVVAGGMESMTKAPYLLPKARGGLRMGHGEVLDHMFTDGLEDPDEGFLMGVFGDRCAARYGFTREAQDAFGAESVQRAQRASADEFPHEIVPVTVRSRKGELQVASDEEPGRWDVAKIPSLRPAFGKDGTVTAASSSKISDGAAATVLMSADTAAALGAQPLARIIAHATHSQEPQWFTTAPVGAIARVLERTGWAVADIDLFEVNEAFAAVSMAAMHEHGIDHARLNVNGGACALGHPVGASGARIVVTLINALQQRGLQRGVAALCNGGGEATAIAIELA